MDYDYDGSNSDGFWEDYDEDDCWYDTDWEYGDDWEEEDGWGDDWQYERY